MDVAAGIKAFIRYTQNLGLSKETSYNYNIVLLGMLRSLEEEYGDQLLSEVKGYMLERFVYDKEGVLDATKNYYAIVIRMFFRYLKESGYMEHNPSEVLRKIRTPRDDEDGELSGEGAYNEREILRLMQHCKGRPASRDKAAIALLSGSGLRASELCSLTVGAWLKRRRGHIYVKRKGGSFRWVAVASYVEPYVEAYLTDRQAWSGHGGIRPEDRLFVTLTGKRMTRQLLYKALAKIQKRAGVQTGVHIFRHTFLTGTSKTSNVKIAQSLANHSNSSITSGYIHTTAEERMAVVNATSWARALEGEEE